MFSVTLQKKKQFGISADEIKHPGRKYMNKRKRETWLNSTRFFFKTGMKD